LGILVFIKNKPIQYEYYRQKNSKSEGIKKHSYAKNSLIIRNAKNGIIIKK